MTKDIANLDKNMAMPPAVPGMEWHDARTLRVEGKGWTDTERFYDRLPARAKGLVREPVWELSHHSAGMCIGFETGATKISVRWTLLSPSLAMNHMPATGVSGLDLYAMHEGQWRWAGVGRLDSQVAQMKIVEGLATGPRQFLLYLPLYNGVESVAIGLPEGLAIAPLPPRKTKPIVFYGTSIVQGGCASRPGMVYTSILGRRLDREAINLGFSGNGKMEPETAALLAELDAGCFVLDAMPNMAPADVTQATIGMVRTIRAARPQTPIVLVGDRIFGNAVLVPAQAAQHKATNKALARAFKDLQAAGVKDLHYIRSRNLIGTDGEGTVDGSHPTDLGFMRMADLLEKTLRMLV